VKKDQAHHFTHERFVCALIAHEVPDDPGRPLAVGDRVKGILPPAAWLPTWAPLGISALHVVRQAGDAERQRGVGRKVEYPLLRPEEVVNLWRKLSDPGAGGVDHAVTGRDWST